MTFGSAELVRCVECRENPVEASYPLCRGCQMDRKRRDRRIKGICYRYGIPFVEAVEVVAWNDAFGDRFMEA